MSGTTASGHYGVELVSVLQVTAATLAGPGSFPGAAVQDGRRRCVSGPGRAVAAARVTGRLGLTRTCARKVRPADAVAAVGVDAAGDVDRPLDANDDRRLPPDVEVSGDRKARELPFGLVVALGAVARIPVLGPRDRLCAVSPAAEGEQPLEVAALRLAREAPRHRRSIGTPPGRRRSLVTVRIAGELLLELPIFGRGGSHGDKILCDHTREGVAVQVRHAGFDRQLDRRRRRQRHAAQQAERQHAVMLDHARVLTRAVDQRDRSRDHRLHAGVDLRVGLEVRKDDRGGGQPLVEPELRLRGVRRYVVRVGRRVEGRERRSDRLHDRARARQERVGLAGLRQEVRLVRVVRANEVLLLDDLGRPVLRVVRRDLDRVPGVLRQDVRPRRHFLHLRVEGHDAPPARVHTVVVTGDPAPGGAVLHDERVRVRRVEVDLRRELEAQPLVQLHAVVAVRRARRLVRDRVPPVEPEALRVPLERQRVRVVVRVRRVRELRLPETLVGLLDAGRVSALVRHRVARARVRVVVRLGADEDVGPAVLARGVHQRRSQVVDRVPHEVVPLPPGDAGHRVRVPVPRGDETVHVLLHVVHGGDRLGGGRLPARRPALAAWDEVAARVAEFRDAAVVVQVDPVEPFHPRQVVHRRRGRVVRVRVLHVERNDHVAVHRWLPVDRLGDRVQDAHDHRRVLRQAEHVRRDPLALHRAVGRDAQEDLGVVALRDVERRVPHEQVFAPVRLVRRVRQVDRVLRRRRLVLALHGHQVRRPRGAVVQHRVLEHRRRQPLPEVLMARTASLPLRRVPGRVVHLVVHDDPGRVALLVQQPVQEPDAERPGLDLARHLLQLKRRREVEAALAVRSVDLDVLRSSGRRLAPEEHRPAVVEDRRGGVSAAGHQATVRNGEDRRRLRGGDGRPAVGLRIHCGRVRRGAENVRGGRQERPHLVRLAAGEEHPAVPEEECGVVRAAVHHRDPADQRPLAGGRVEQLDRVARRAAETAGRHCRERVRKRRGQREVVAALVHRLVVVGVDEAAHQRIEHLDRRQRTVLVTAAGDQDEVQVRPVALREARFRRGEDDPPGVGAGSPHGLHVRVRRDRERLERPGDRVENLRRVQVAGRVAARVLHAAGDEHLAGAQEHRDVGGPGRGHGAVRRGEAVRGRVVDLGRIHRIAVRVETADEQDLRRRQRVAGVRRLSREQKRRGVVGPRRAHQGGRLVQHPVRLELQGVVGEGVLRPRGGVRGGGRSAGDQDVARVERERPGADPSLGQVARVLAARRVPPPLRGGEEGRQVVEVEVLLRVDPVTDLALAVQRTHAHQDRDLHLLGVLEGTPAELVVHARSVGRGQVQRAVPDRRGGRRPPVEGRDFLRGHPHVLVLVFQHEVVHRDGHRVAVRVDGAPLDDHVLVDGVVVRPFRRDHHAGDRHGRSAVVVHAERVRRLPGTDLLALVGPGRGRADAELHAGEGLEPRVAERVERDAPVVGVHVVLDHITPRPDVLLGVPHEGVQGAGTGRGVERAKPVVAGDDLDDRRSRILVVRVVDDHRHTRVGRVRDLDAAVGLRSRRRRHPGHDLLRGRVVEPVLDLDRGRVVLGVPDAVEDLDPTEVRADSSRPLETSWCLEAEDLGRGVLTELVTAFATTTPASATGGGDGQDCSERGEEKPPRGAMLLHDCVTSQDELLADTPAGNLRRTWKEGRALCSAAGRPREGRGWSLAVRTTSPRSRVRQKPRSSRRPQGLVWQGQRRRRTLCPSPGHDEKPRLRGSRGRCGYRNRVCRSECVLGRATAA